MATEANQGSFQAGWTGVREGWSRSVVGTVARSADYLYLREMGKTPLTQESYNKKYKGRGIIPGQDAFKYDPDMTEEEAWVRYRDQLQMGVRAADMAGHEKMAFAGSLAGSILSLDLPLFAALPEAKFLNLAGTTGKVGADLLAANAARFSVRRTVDDIANASLNAGLQNTALEPAMFGADHWLDRPHEVGDSVTNLLAGYGLGIVIGGTKTAWRAYSPDLRMAASQRAMRSALDGETVDSVLGAMMTSEEDVAAAARVAHTTVAEDLNKVDIPEDISAMEASRELTDKGYGNIPEEEALQRLIKESIAQKKEKGVASLFTEEDPKNLPAKVVLRMKKERALADDLRAKVTRRNAGAGAEAKEARASYLERTKAFREKARLAKTEDERLLDLWFTNIFGTKVHYVDGDVSMQTGILGLSSPHEPNRVYVRAGALDDRSGVSMLRIAGHEMGHVIRFRDPELWVSMTDAMADIRTNRHFADSYREVASAKKRSHLWDKMSFFEKMDETYATTLGHAMQTPDFWVSLNKTSKVDGRRLVGYLLKTTDAFESARVALGKDETARGKVAPLEAQLAKALSALKESGVYKFASKQEAVSAWEYGINKRDRPLGTDKKAVIYEGYSRQKDRFSKSVDVVQQPVVQMNKSMLRQVERLDATLNWMFSDAGNIRGTLKDRSGSHKLVKTFERAVSSDPRSYLVMAFYRNLTPEGREALDKLINKTYTQDQKVDPKKFAQDAFELYPLATYKDTGKVDAKKNPIYEFSIYIDDKKPLWSENRKAEDFEIDDYKMAVRESVDTLVEAFNDVEARRAKAVSGVSDEAFEKYLKFQKDELVGYLTSLSRDDLREMTVQDLRDGYVTYLGEQMTRAAAHKDEVRYDTLVEMVKGKPKITRTEKRVPAGEKYANLADGSQEDYSPTSSADDAETAKLRDAHEKLVEAAWEKVQKDLQETGRQPEWAAKWEAFDPDANYPHPDDLKAGDVTDRGVKEAFQILRGQMFKDHMERIVDENPPLYSLYSKYMSEAQKEQFHKEVYANIDQRIYDNRRELRRALDPRTKDLLMGKGKTPIMTSNDAALARAVSHDSPVKELETDHMPDWMMESDDILSEDALWGDTAMEMPSAEAGAMMEAALKAASKARGELKAQADAAIARSAAQLDTGYARYSPWLEDVAKLAQKDLPDLLERNNLTDFEVEDTPLKPGEVRPPTPLRTAAQEELHGVIKAHKAEMRATLKDLENIVANRQREQGDDAPETDFALERFDLHMRLLNKDRTAAEKAAKADIKGEFTGRIRGEVMAHEAGNHIRSLGRKSPGHLFSALDSQPRAGVVGAGRGLAADVRALREADITPLTQLLVANGLAEHWQNNSLVQVVLHYIETGEAKTPEVKALGDTLRKTVDVGAGRINSLGGAYRFLPKYVFSQIHDASKITRNRAAWQSYLMQSIDWEATGRFMGVMDTEAKRTAYLDAVFDLLTQSLENPLALSLEEFGGNIRSQTSLRRTLHLLPGKGFEYDMVFGSGNTGAEILSQIGRRAEKAAIMQFGGPKYKATWAKEMSSMGIQLGNPFSEIRRMDSTFRHITGEWDHPVDKGLAAMGRAVRNAMNSAALWLGGISSITDVGNIVSMLRWAGVESKDLHSRVLASMTEAAMTKEGRIVLEGWGAGIQSVQGAFTRLMGDSWWERGAQRASDFTFKWSGTELSTRLYQHAAMDHLTRNFGRMTPDKVTAEFSNWLNHYQISQAEWAEMASHIGTVEGLEGPRLGPDMIKNPDLSLKLRAALLDTISYGQLQPSASNEALLRMGLKAGTWGGEGMRAITQYKGYPLAVLTKVKARFKYGYGIDQQAPSFFGQVPRGLGGIESLVWSASMITLAYLALGAKDALRGNEPMNPFEPDHWNFGNLTRILGQAGAGPVATIEQFSSPSQALGPAFGSAYRLGKAFASGAPGAGYRRTEAVFGALPGASLAPLQQARRKIIYEVGPIAYRTALDSAQEFREEKTGQERLLDFKD